MALVPFRLSGAAADQSAGERIFQIGCYSLRIQQDSRGGASLRPLTHDQFETEADKAIVQSNAVAQASQAAGAVRAAAPADGTANALSVLLTASPLSDMSEKNIEIPGSGTHSLMNVGLVVWQSGFVLAEYLLRSQPFGPCWQDITVIDLGTGTGIVGIALALAGATVALTDLPHVLPLADRNVTANCGAGGSLRAPLVLEHRWGDAATASSLRAALAGDTPGHMAGSKCGQRVALAATSTQVGCGPSLTNGDAITVTASSAAARAGQPTHPCSMQLNHVPDLITAADVLYEPSLYCALLDSLVALCAPHTLVFISYRMRNICEQLFAKAASARGFAVEEVPAEQLHEEYCDGQYFVLRLCRMEPMDIDVL